MDWKKHSKELLSNISDDYKKLNKLINLEKAPRKRSLSYSLVCEKNITKMIMNILDSKDYHYNMDILLNSVDGISIPKELSKNNRWQPDLVIQDKNNNIVAIIEIKYQIGYWDYKKDIEKIKKYKYEDKTIIVNLLESKHTKKVNTAIKDFTKSNIKFYTLYNSKIEYNEIDGTRFEDIYDGNNGFEAFLDEISKL